MQTPPTPAPTAHGARAVGARRPTRPAAPSSRGAPSPRTRSCGMREPPRGRGPPVCPPPGHRGRGSPGQLRIAVGLDLDLHRKATGRVVQASSSRSTGVSSVGVPSRARRRASRSSLHSVWCAQPRNVVELLSHGSCSRTSRPSAVKQASVSRPSTGPASVACRAARDESGPASRPRRCAHNGGRVATTIRVALVPTCRVCVTDRLPCREHDDKPNRATRLRPGAAAGGPGRLDTAVASITKSTNPR